MSDHDRQLEDYLIGLPVPIATTLRTLPPTANLARAVEAVLRLLHEPHWLAAAGSLPVHLVRGVVATPAVTPAHVFLQLAVPPDGSAAAQKSAWLAAVKLLRVLADTVHPLDSKPRRKQLTQVASSPLLHALQGVAANTAEVPLEMLVVLALDGSDASLDALIPHLDLALGARDARLERLAKIRPFVKRTPALDALFAELDAAVDARRRTSPALAFAEAIGVGRLPLFWCTFQLMSSERNESGVPRYQGIVRIDSREEPWFSVVVELVGSGADRSQDRTTRFDPIAGTDELGIGRCQPAELPAWLRSAAKTLGTDWDRYYVRTDADAAKISNWLITG